MDTRNNEMIPPKKIDITKEWILDTLDKYITREEVRCGIVPGGDLAMLEDLYKIKQRLPYLWGNDNGTR